MTYLTELSESQLSDVCGGGHHHHNNYCGSSSKKGSGGLSHLMSMLTKLTGSLNTSIVIISNSTINGNVTINVSQKASV
ncbi:MAG: hypothetical protein K2X98_00785 [Alphaproteobacteria bacterium]|nr:hypothetical protein [Alphaproteobacteria bacterium]